ncbi:anti-sigma factor antagonist [Kibdelosporangium persicum]|uniref:Anti-sigma factor antagonist n=1 Tax=Kibdelosporangium persicum TaxID=2698649 RepID=A0ABX2F804_9PSEU|nr:anti-sigma factor antagonist [Kibdelosporangium persicum]NRN67022.1 Anti-sigma factor antagonist [Kibdelosporangium persicum]
MSFQAKVRSQDGVVTFRLAGELDSRSAPRFHEMITQAVVPAARKLVLQMDELSYMSSAGLRCLVYAHQRAGNGVDIELVGTQPEVAETIRLTGFDRSLIMRAHR